MSWVPFLTVLLYHLSGKNSYPDHPQLPSSSTLAHELLRKAVNLPPESYHYWFTISDPTRFLTLSEIILASRVKPHFWTADTKLENFLHFPEMSSYHFVFNRRPFLLSQRKWKPQRGRPSTSCLQPYKPRCTCTLFLSFLKRRLCSPPRPLCLLSFRVLRNLALSKTLPVSPLPWPQLLLTNIHKLLFKTKWNQIPPVPMSAPFQPCSLCPITAWYFKVTLSLASATNICPPPWGTETSHWGHQ